MRITLSQVKEALINIANQRGRPHYELKVVRNVYDSIRFDYNHPLKNTVMQELFTLYSHLYKDDVNSKNFNKKEAWEKILKIKSYYAGQKTLVLKSGVSERTISLLLRQKTELTARVWRRISPVIDEVLKDLHQHSIEKEKKSHGRYVTYRRGCRCDGCRMAWRAYIQERTLKRSLAQSEHHNDISLDIVVEDPTVK